MNYFLYLIGGVAILLGVLPLFNRSEVAGPATTGLAIGASLITGIVMCALGGIIGLLKAIARNPARYTVVSKF